jgi:hypothetical protein
MQFLVVLSCHLDNDAVEIGETALLSQKIVLTRESSTISNISSSFFIHIPYDSQPRKAWTCGRYSVLVYSEIMTTIGRRCVPRILRPTSGRSLSLV